MENIGADEDFYKNYEGNLLSTFKFSKMWGLWVFMFNFKSLPLLFAWNRCIYVDWEDIDADVHMYEHTQMNICTQKRSTGKEREDNMAKRSFWETINKGKEAKKSVCV